MSLAAYVAAERLASHPAIEAHRAALVVLLVLAGAADDGGVSWCSAATIATRAGMGASTVRRHLRTLQDAGLVAILEGDEAPNGLGSDGSVRARRVPIVPHPHRRTDPIVGLVDVEPKTLARRSQDGLRKGTPPGHREPTPLPVIGSPPLPTTDRGGSRPSGEGDSRPSGADPAYEPASEPANESARADVDPAPKPKPASKVHPRVEAAMAEVMPDLIAWHTQHNNRAPHGRTTSAWTKALATRLADNGVSEQAVAERVQDIRTVLAWWAKPNIWYSAPDVADALKAAAKLDKLVMWARDDERKRAGPRRHGGPGPFRAPEHYVDFSGMRDPRTFQPTPQEVLDALGAGMEE